MVPSSCKGIYKMKYKATEEVQRFKAGLVAKGTANRRALNQETFSPVVKMGFQIQGETRPACRLLKFLYGLKQAPRQWNAKLSEALLRFGFMQSQHDHSLFIKGSRSQRGILMHQRKYTLELIYELGLGAAKPAATPIEANIKLTTKEYDEHTSSSNATDDEVLIDISQYQRLLGKQLYLTVTRPDIAYSIQTLSQLRSHLEAAQRVVRYVKNQPGQGILLSSKQRNTITTYCDADWAACPITMKSVTCFFIKYGNSLISWKSKK
ncbi:PREDICTED: uncharacterized protein LOC109219284 [Nicotiana attenuata]|uniref:uncharacterized protein LOC109219284 n=1 Tax=Nicotiana attenuata TaxID=49451 RepID=UPI00090521B0|nr:PREDICTED: uncharacterized protein LOC109219284 [Nicotiana attenuata]